MHRLLDWRSALIDYLGRAARAPFVEGEHDCALFLAGGVEVMTGVDYAAPYRGRYSSTKGGLRILRKDGFDSHIALARAHLDTKPLAFAREGDGAVVPGDDGDALGIVQGESIYVLRPSGLGLVPLTASTLILEV